MTAEERGPFGASLTVLLAAGVVVAGFLVYAIRPHQEEPRQAEEEKPAAPATPRRKAGRPKGSKSKAKRPAEAPTEPAREEATDDNPT